MKLLLIHPSSFILHPCFVVGLLLLLLLPPFIERLLRRSGRLEPNYRGERIVQSYGLVTLIWASAMLALCAWIWPAARQVYILWLVACIGFGLLGFVDDTWGTKRIKGIRGHFRAALRDHTITTGLIKAVGGVGLAVWIGHTLRPDSLSGALLSAALIALGANAINLLDLRPGRAGGVFLAAAVPLIGFQLISQKAVVPLLLVAIPTLVVWWRDRQAQVMMGDTGSNLLGACLGLALACMHSLPVQIAALTLLVALHLAAERTSLTRVIEHNPLLRSLDRLTGVR